MQQKVYTKFSARWIRERDCKASGHVVGEGTRFADFFAGLPLLEGFSVVSGAFGFWPRFLVGSSEGSDAFVDGDCVVVGLLPLRPSTAWWLSVSSSSGLFRF